jgi:hypothetical protein
MTAAARRREQRVQVVRRFFELLRRKEIDAWAERWHEHTPEGMGALLFDGRCTEDRLILRHAGPRDSNP